jgi:pimeloyl-ACP methyl ester carboxylesterase
MASRKYVKILTPVMLLVIVYLVGPAPDAPSYRPEMPAVPTAPDDLVTYVQTREQQHKLKADNEARIVWVDSSKSKTPYSIVYLHGFSASQKEGDPVHLRLAKTFGCNLYLSRLSDHGVDTTEALQLFTADRIWESAKEALAIGEAIGEKVILVSTSTGGTLALKLAAEYPDRVHALVNMSPNIEINNPAAFLANNPWGLYIARLVMGGKYRDSGPSNEKSQYWNDKYRLESVVQLQELLESTMTDETFSRITQPALTLYYYKDEEHQDPEVKVSAMLKMHEKLATPAHLKIHKAIPNAEAHVIGGALVSKDVETVYTECEKFLTDIVHLTKMPIAKLNNQIF